MAIPKRTKKKTVRASRRVGVNAAPIEKGFESVQYYFQNEVSKKDAVDQVKTFVKKQFKKKDAQFILSNPEWKLLSSYYLAATCFWYNSALEESEKSKYWYDASIKRLANLVEPGKALHYEKLQAKHDSANVVSLSPQQRLQRKIGQTIMQDLDELEEAWINGEKASIDVYGLFRKHGLSGSATLPVRQVVEGWLLDYEDAYHKRCEQAVEGYSHLKRPELNRRIKECEAMLADLDRIKSAAKAQRKVKVARPQSIDKQVSKIKYKKEDDSFKIVSIQPAQIIGKARLYVFNTKYRRLTEYVTYDPKGFIVSGTTIKNFDKESSRTLTLRKPLDILPTVAQCTPRQLIKLLDDIKTKPAVPNGRINEDTVLLRVEKK
ncbi:MAG: hypothetical protein ACPHQD_17510 [Vibrio toranzoniae]|uniref:hypothetical protein n=1 Tax=Vibrio toranzoniae TaxID=1194427 RepID=UPI003C414F90